MDRAMKTGVMRKIRRMLLVDRDGATAVEFALLMPAFVTGLLIVIEVSNFLWARSSIDNAAREAVRFGVVRSPWGEQWPGSASILEGQMETEAVNKVTGARLKADRTTTDATVDIDNQVININVQYAYSPLIVPTSLINNATLTTTAAMDLHRP